MTQIMRISYHMYNSSDNNKGYGSILLKTETKTIGRATSKSRSKYASRLSRQKIQKMWQTQLPLCRRARTRKLLPFCQYAWAKPYHGLRLFQKPRQGQTRSGQLSSCPKNYGRNQQHQSRSVSSEGNTVEGKSWTSKWKPPP